jgi:hypothetical protein
MITGRRWALFRALLFLSGLTLVGYVAYRYTLAQPPDHGSLYGKIFPLSLLLALTGISLAASPHLLTRLRGRPGMACRGALTAFGGAWMATGVACTRSLAAGVPEAPLGGTIDLLHMASGHVYLPVGVVALAWGSARVARWLGAEEAPPAGVGEPALTVARL